MIEVLERIGINLSLSFIYILLFRHLITPTVIVNTDFQVIILYFLLAGKEAQEAVVTVDGEVYGTYSLAKDQTIEIQDGNRLRIQNGQAKMEWADCPDQLCVHQKAISRTGESIICLPNQVVVSVQGSKESELDGIVN